MPHVYIVECRDGSYHVGSTWDLERRISQHNAGEGAKYTPWRRPVRLVGSAEYDRVEDTDAFEKQVQGGAAPRDARSSRDASTTSPR